MTLLRRSIFAATVLLGLSTCQVARAQVELINPTVNIPLPQITFSPGINPFIGTFSNDALNIIRAHQVALQQVQAALQYLAIHRKDILAGQNGWYNQNFGDFYDPNSPFAGLYNRIVKHDTGTLDRFGNTIYEDWYNTAHYDRVVATFQQIQIALQSAITYDLGAQPGPELVPGNGTTPDTIFDTYRNGQITVGDPAFGTPFIPDTHSPVPIDPLTGLPFIDPVTGLPFTFPPLQGDPAINNLAVTLLGPDRGLVQWGFSTSFTPEHLNQIATNPGNLLPWDDDNDLTTVANPLTPDQELAFFKDRLDAYSIHDLLTDLTTVYVGGAFLNESQRSNSGVTGEPNPFFHPSEFNQYQQIIMALAQSEGSLAGGANIENGTADFFGPSAYFFEALDGQSYASFVDLFEPVQDGGIGDGSLLPPPGKTGNRDSDFIPLVPGS